VVGQYRYNPEYLEDKICFAGDISLASVPRLKKLLRNYNMQSATMDLYAHMPIVKLAAVKENKSWTINFNPDGLLGDQVRNSAGKG
jgi:hypothetical protein